MITVAMSTVVHAPRERVWRAISSPGEVIRWDERSLPPERPPADYPRIDRVAHWRYRLGSVTVDLVDRPVEVVPGKRLRHAMSIGAFAFEETYTLADEVETGCTRLSLRLTAASNTIPVLGGALDRFDVRKLASGMVDRALRALQQWCEAADPTDEGAPAPDAPPR